MDWISPGGVKYRAPYGANKQRTQHVKKKDATHKMNMIMMATIKMIMIGLARIRLVAAPADE